MGAKQPLVMTKEDSVFEREVQEEITGLEHYGSPREGDWFCELNAILGPSHAHSLFVSFAIAKKGAHESGFFFFFGDRRMN